MQWRKDSTGNLLDVANEALDFRDDGTSNVTNSTKSKADNRLGNGLNGRQDKLELGLDSLQDIY